MLSLSIHHSIFVEFFHACIALQVSIRIFLIGNMRMLQVFLYHHQIYFLLLLFNFIFHLFLRSLIFHQDLPFLLEHHLLQAFSMCLHQLNLLISYTLFNAILRNQPKPYMLIINILANIILFFLVYLKFSSNMSGTLIH